MAKSSDQAYEVADTCFDVRTRRSATRIDFLTRFPRNYAYSRFEIIGCTFSRASCAVNRTSAPE